MWSRNEGTWISNKSLWCASYPVCFFKKCMLRSICSKKHVIKRPQYIGQRSMRHGKCL